MKAQEWNLPASSVQFEWFSQSERAADNRLKQHRGETIRMLIEPDPVTGITKLQANPNNLNCVNLLDPEFFPMDYKAELVHELTHIKQSHFLRILTEDEFCHEVQLAKLTRLKADAGHLFSQDGMTSAYRLPLDLKKQMANYIYALLPEINKSTELELLELGAHQS